MNHHTHPHTHPRMHQRVYLFAAACGLAATAAGQVVYTEDFQANSTITQLQAAGWAFRNQSEPQNRLGWDLDYSGGPVGWMWLEGSTWAGDGEISTWAIMPAIGGQQAGMPMRFHAYGADANPPRYDWLELRYSPSGGTSTGSDADDIGDFTQLLWSAEPGDLGLWWNGPLEVTLPGSGRLAWRYCRSGPDESGRMGVDGLEIGSPTADVPFPDPGETVHWTLDMSPIVIDSDKTIVDDGTVVVEPGVEIQIAANKWLTIDGTLTGGGADAQLVALRGASGGGVDVGATGRIELDFAEIATRVTENNGSRVTLRDSVVREPYGGFTFGRTALNVFERCVIEEDFFEPWGTLVLRDTVLTGSNLRLMHYNRLENVTAHAPIQFIAGYQDVFIDTVQVSDVFDGAGLEANYATWGGADILLGANNTIQNNQYAIKLRGPGLHPDSVFPAGNFNEAVLLEMAGGGLRYNRMTWPDLGVPYHALGRVFIQGALDIDPGLLFQSAPGAWFYFLTTQSDYRVRGTPENPLRFEPLYPGQRWGSVLFDQGMNLIEHALIENADIAIAGAEGIHYVNECTISQSGTGVRPSEGYFYVSGTRFLNNEIGAEEDNSPIFVGLNLNGDARPNLFEGNGLAVNGILGPNGEWLRIPAEHNWWNASNGPSGGFGGSGDPADSNTDPFPYLTSRPDLSDTPPVVRLITRPYLYAVPGDTLIIEWTAEDDGAIASQRIVAQNALNQWVTLASNLPGAARSAEVVLPPRLMRVRIVATDDAGQESFEQFSLRVPHEAPTGDINFTTDVSNGFTGGQEIDICISGTGWSNLDRMYLELGGEERWILGPGISGFCSISTMRIPYISTDRARLAVDASGTNNLEWYFSDQFEIRPPADLGDAPPQITMTSPADGATFRGGSVIPIAWTASDDQGVREFKIQYSTNAGYTWNTLRHRLPGDLRSYNWKLPASAGIDDLRVRIQAADLNFQASTDGDDHVLTVTPGDACPADFNTDGQVNTLDVLAFLNAWSAGDTSADFNQDGAVNTLDVLAFLNAWSAGC